MKMHMDVLFLIFVLLYLIIMAVLVVFNVMAIRHILRFRYRGDLSMAVLLGYIIVVAVLLLMTTFSLLALSIAGNPGGML